MREIESKKRLGFAVLLLALLIVPLVFSSSLINLTSRLFSTNTFSGGGTTSSTTRVSVNPLATIDSRLQGTNASKFTVSVQVSDVTDLFTWQINMTWNPSILSVNNIVRGEFLYRTASQNKTSSAPRSYGGLGYVMNVTKNANGYVAITESILEDALPGSVSGISGSGTLVEVEFLVLNYGCTGLNISLTGGLPTTLLNSTGGTITLLPANVSNGYFRNRILGDADGDKKVNIFDILEVQEHWWPGPPQGPGGYNRDVDLDYDGNVNLFDILVVQGNWGHSL